MNKIFKHARLFITVFFLLISNVFSQSNPEFSIETTTFSNYTNIFQSWEEYGTIIYINESNNYKYLKYPSKEIIVQFSLEANEHLYNIGKYIFDNDENYEILVQKTVNSSTQYFIKDVNSNTIQAQFDNAGSNYILNQFYIIENNKLKWLYGFTEVNSNGDSLFTLYDVDKSTGEFSSVYSKSLTGNETVNGLSKDYYDTDENYELTIQETIGSSYPFKYHFKVIDIKTSNIQFVLNNPNISYSVMPYPFYNENYSSYQYKIVVGEIHDNGQKFTKVYSLGTGTNIQFNKPKILDKFKLHQNYPNPFNSSTKIKYYLPESGYVQIKIYDIQGRYIADVFKGIKPAGEQSFVWSESRISTGLYIYEILHNGQILGSKKALFLK